MKKNLINNWTGLKQILKFSEVQLWISLKSLEGKGINNHFYVGRRTEPFLQQRATPASGRAGRSWMATSPEELCWLHSFVELETVHSCRAPTTVSAQLEWESSIQWCCFLGRDQFIHAEGFSNPFSNRCCISKRTRGGN